MMTAVITILSTQNLRHTEFKHTEFKAMMYIK